MWWSYERYLERLLQHVRIDGEAFVWLVGTTPPRGGCNVPQFRAEGAGVYPHRFYLKLVAAFWEEKARGYKASGSATASDYFPADEWTHPIGVGFVNKGCKMSCWFDIVLFISYLTTKKGQAASLNPLIFLERAMGIEPTTFSLGS
jgi:hypothetical protein